MDAFERLVPFYYVHAGGGQVNYIDLKHDWNIFFKYEKEYQALATRRAPPLCLGSCTPSAFRNPHQGLR